MKTYKLALGILLITACTPLTRVRVLKPPLSGIKDIKKIAVIDLIASDDYGPDTLQEIRQRLVEKLNKNTPYEVLSPKKTDSVLESEKYKKEDYQDISSAGKISRALGVDTLIYGTVLAYDSSDEVEHIKGERDPSSGERLFKDRLKFIRVVDIAIKFEIVTTNADKPVVKTLHSEARSDEVGHRDSFAKESLVPEEELFITARDEVITSLIHLIAPHYVEEEWPIKTGTSKNQELIDGIESAIAGKWDAAKSSWNAVTADEDSSPTDQDAARFNLGLLAESEDKLEIAAKIFKELHDKNSDSDSEEILERIKNKEGKKKGE